MFEAYLSGEARALYGAHFANSADVARMQSRVRPLAPSLAKTLEEQNARYTPSAKRNAHLQALRDGAAAVVTGQQMGLFLGPLFTLYKAATAIRLAKELSEQWGKPVVPVFWLQTEDHDLAEIATTSVPGAHGTPHEIRTPAPNERCSVAHCVLPHEITACLDELDVILGHLPHAEEHLQHLRRHYRPGQLWSNAFAQLLADLFAPHGLVLLEPRDPDVAALTTPVLEQSLVRAQELSHALTQRVSELRATGFEPGVFVRPNAPLCFYHPQGADHARFRLTCEDNALVEVGGTGKHSLDALLRRLHADPLSFSSSALLRPIVQDSLLPTVAYVAGPGEVTYFAQLEPLYAAFDVPMPLIVPRTRLRVVDDKTRKLCEKLGVMPKDTHQSPDLLLAQGRSIAQGTTGAALTQQLQESLLKGLQALTPELNHLGPGLDSALEKTRATVSMALSKLAEKVDKARLHQDEEAVLAIGRIKGFLFPNGVPQERLLGFSYFAARYGERFFVEQVLKACQPFESAVVELNL